MKKSNVAVLLIVLLLLFPLFVSFPETKYSSAQSPLDLFEIGFGPQALTPLSSALPVFSYHDQLWMTSVYGGANVFLQYTQNGIVYDAASAFIQSNAITLLYTFADISALNWMLVIEVGGSIGNLEVPLTYVSPSSISGVSGSILPFFSNNQLSVNFSYSGSQTYNSQICLAGSPPPATAQIPIPSSFGKGVVDVTLNSSGNGAQLFTFGNISKATAFSFETFYPYSYSRPNSTGLVSTNLEAQSSSSVVLSSGTKANVTVNDLVSIRPGRFTLRGIFDSGGNASVSETAVLGIPNSTWIWLGGCFPSIETSPTSFTSSTNIPSLGLAPQVLYLVWDESGVEFVRIFSLNYSIPRIDFNTRPFNAQLSNIGIIVTGSKPSISSYSFTNSTLYMIGAFPQSVRFNITFDGIPFVSDQVTIPSPSSVPDVNIPLSRIIINATNEGRAVSGANIFILRGTATIVADLTNKTGMVEFFVPTGNYSIFASFSGSNSTKNGVSALAGNSIVVSFSFEVSTSNPPLPDYLTPLLVILAVGIVGNVLVWVWGIRRRRYLA